MQLLLLFLLLFSSRGNLLETPVVRSSSTWDVESVGSIHASTMARNNADVYITTVTGNLIHHNRGSIFEPDPTDNKILCQSGVALSYENDTDEPSTVVYAYDNVLQALNASSLVPIWNIEVDGDVVGTPVIGNGRVYAVYNNQGGHVAVVDLQSGDLEQDVEALEDAPNVGVAFGSPTGRTTSPNRVVLVFGSDLGEAPAENDLTTLWVLVHDTDQPAEIRYASTQARSTRVAPGLSQDATQVLLPQTHGRMAGWTGDRSIADVINEESQEIRPRWSFSMLRDNEDPNRPVPATPVLSENEQAAFMVGPTNHIYGFNIQRRRSVWMETVSETHVAAPVYSVVGGGAGNSNVVYFLSRDGALRQVDPSSGEIVWELTCQDWSGNSECDAVAGFAISDNANAVFLADVRSGVVADIQVATFETDQPTDIPSSMPSITPTGAPSAATEAPSASPSVSPSLPPIAGPPTNSPPATDGDSALSQGAVIGLSIALIVIALLMAVLAFLVCRHNRRKTAAAKNRTVVAYDLEEAQGDGDTSKLAVVGTPDAMQRSISRESSQLDSIAESEDDDARVAGSVADKGSITPAVSAFSPIQEAGSYDGSEVGYEMSLTETPGEKRGEVNYDTTVKATRAISPPPASLQQPVLFVEEEKKDDRSVEIANDAFDADEATSGPEDEPGRIKKTPPRPTHIVDDDSVDGSMYLEGDDVGMGPSDELGSSDMLYQSQLAVPVAADPLDYDEHDVAPRHPHKGGNYRGRAGLFSRMGHSRPKPVPRHTYSSRDAPIPGGAKPTLPYVPMGQTYPKKEQMVTKSNEEALAPAPASDTWTFFMSNLFGEDPRRSTSPVPPPPPPADDDSVTPPPPPRSYAL